MWDHQVGADLLYRNPTFPRDERWADHNMSRPSQVVDTGKAPNPREGGEFTISVLDWETQKSPTGRTVSKRTPGFLRRVRAYFQSQKDEDRALDLSPQTPITHEV